MILQALFQYYQRSLDEPDSMIAPRGMQHQEIPNVIVLSPEGEFVNLLILRGENGSARKFYVPRERVRSGTKSYEFPNALWDHVGFVLGYSKDDPENAKKQHASFKKLLENLIEGQADVPASVKAVRKFLKKGDYQKVFASPNWEKAIQRVGNFSFQIQGEQELVCQNPWVLSRFQTLCKEKDVRQQICLVSGLLDTPVRTHNKIKQVWGNPQRDRSLVSFNDDAFCSYGKKQSYNSPIGSNAEFAYTTALNTLLAKGSRQRMQVGDASTVFWAKEKHPIEQEILNLFADQGKDSGKDNTEAVRSLISSVKTGVYPPEDDLPFYMLGLSPNAARIAVRFWYEGTVKDFKQKVCDHFLDIEIEHGPKEFEYLSLSNLLKSTAIDNDRDKIQPNLAGEFMQSILKGTPYPRSLLPAVLRRIKAEQAKKSPDGRVYQNVTYPRASLIKGILARNARFYLQKEKEVGVSLDRENINIGYRLGRLFAVLERVQQAALGDINATIRDRFYGAASTNPVTVFPRLMKLKNYYLPKIESKGRVVNLEKEISEILAEVVSFPAHLSLEDQGRFAIGYYHERNDFFKKHDKKEGGEEE